MLHENICTSEKLAAVSSGAEVLYYRLLTQVDDNGHIENDARIIRSRCFPIQESITSDDVTKWLYELTTVRNGNGGEPLIAVYEAAGGKYLHFNRFADFNKIPHGYHRYEKCPPFPDGSNDDAGGLAHDGAAWRSNGAKSISISKTKSIHITTPLRGAWERFWKAYPRKVAKGTAVKVFAKLAPDVHLLDKILAAIEAQKKSEQWRKDAGQFIPHPATWLNQRRWEDEESQVAVSDSAPLSFQPATVSPTGKEVYERFGG